jgi:hypothetical protein
MKTVLLSAGDKKLSKLLKAASSPVALMERDGGALALRGFIVPAGHPSMREHAGHHVAPAASPKPARAAAPKKPAKPKAKARSKAKAGGSFAERMAKARAAKAKGKR